MQTEKSSRSTLWASVLSDLQARIEADEFIDRFPTDRELMIHYGVSRHTVREAVRRLDTVDRRPRRGGRIRPVPTALEALMKTLRVLGVRMTTSTADIALHRTDSDVAGVLGADGVTPLLVTTAVLCADDRPLVALETWQLLSASLPGDLAQRILHEQPDPPVVPITQTTTPVTPGAGICGLLGLPEGRAVFCIEALLRVNDTATVWQRAFVRPDRYPCLLQFTAG
ncbi:GntR family transcriptional regulator [Streptomyces sp. NPDC088752]|uniref:GntR family transcriptional regulator n=1 Tax=Streptomyces sp. NPDC088752 TaxID=3154963 RepID=UPI0034360882